MKKQLTVLMIFLFLLSCQTQQHENVTPLGWTLVYKHDKQGNALYGSKEKLMEAIQNGLSVRVGYGSQISEDRSIEHLSDAQFLTILKIVDQHEVYAQLAPIMRQDPFKTNDTIAIKMVPKYQWRTTIGTNGISSNVMVDKFNDSLQGSNENRRGAMWFTNYPSKFKAKNKTLTFK